jgi:CubicO group peptidase (beta-lactamase class C family)
MNRLTQSAAVTLMDYPEGGSGKKFLYPRLRFYRNSELPLVMIVAICILLTACGRSLPPQEASVRAVPPELTPVRDSIIGLIQSGRIPSVAIAVVRDGEILWEEGFGWADKERMIPASHHTVYQIASLTKPITATGALVLAERGMLPLHSPVNHHLPASRITSRAGSSDSVTVAHLLTHTGGLPGYWNDFFQDESFTPPSADGIIRKYAFTVHEPGEEMGSYLPMRVPKSIYSNLGFHILGTAIEFVSRRPLADFLSQEVFHPLMMTSSTLNRAEIPDSLLARGYDVEGDPFPVFTSTSPAGGAALSSARDLALFMQFQLGFHPHGARVLQPSTVAEMQRGHVEANPPHLKQGLAWLVTEYEQDYREVSHAGAMQGAAAWMNLYPLEGMGIVVLINQQEPQLAMELAGMIAGALAPHLAERLGWQLDVLSGRQPPNTHDPFQSPPPIRGRFSGHIDALGHRIPLTLHYAEDGSVTACLQGAPPVVGSGGRFALRIEIPETRRSEHVLALRLDRQPHEYPTRLTGQAAAVSVEPRSHFHLPFWVELDRSHGSATRSADCR